MFFELLFLASGFNVIVLALVLFNKRLIPEPSANKLFVFMLACMFLYSIMVLMRYISIQHSFNQLLVYYLPIEEIVFTLIPPVMYLFVKNLFEKTYKLNLKRLIPHLIPCFIFILFGVYFMLQHPTFRVNLLHKTFAQNTIEFHLMNSLIYIQVIGYYFYCYRFINTKLKISSNICISNTQYNYCWLKQYILITMIYTFLTIPGYIYFQNEEIKIIITQLGIEIQFLYFFIRWAFNVEGTLFKSHYITRKNTNKIEADVAKLQLSIIETYIKEHKPYLNEKCTIQIVANNTGLTVHQISNVINTSLKKSFSDFINEYRINEAIQQLVSSKSKYSTVESIGLDCGFGSKSTFNRAFKKYTNITPSEYIKRYNSSTQ